MLLFCLLYSAFFLQGLGRIVDVVGGLLWVYVGGFGGTPEVVQGDVIRVAVVLVRLTTPTAHAHGSVTSSK